MTQPDEPGCMVQVLLRCTPGERLPLLGALMRLVREHAMSWPGFMGADVLSGTDGTRLTATFAWRTRADWLAFGADPVVTAAAAAIAAQHPDVAEVELALQVGPPASAAGASSSY